MRPRKPLLHISRGQHIYVGRFGYTHHGIYISPKRVIHFNGGPFQSNKDSVICYATLEEFADGGTVKIKDYADQPCFSRFKTVRRAKSKLGMGGYDLFEHNCEHFATWCSTNEAVSKQVGDFAESLATVSAVLMVPSVLGLVPFLLGTGLREMTQIDTEF